MKRPVIVRGIIFVEAVLKHLINKPAVNSFVEVWRFDSEQEKPKRVTDEMVKSERLNALRRKDPALDAAIEMLDLEIAE